MLSKELELTLNLAFKEAREKRHEFMTVEHLLLSLLDNPTAAEVLRAGGPIHEEYFPKHFVAAYLAEFRCWLLARHNPDSAL